MQDKIICLIGKSGTGKTTIAKELKKNYKVNMIYSYTTREKREEEEWGHIFTTEYRYNWMKENCPGLIVSEVYYNENYYWAEKWQYKDKGISIYIIDPKGRDILLNRVNDAEIITIYLSCNRYERINRMYDRGDSKENIENRMDFDENFFKDIENNEDYYVSIITDGYLDEVVDTIADIIGCEGRAVTYRKVQ